MKITCDTDLNSILDSDEIETIISGASKNIRNCTRPRRFNVAREIEGEGIKNAELSGENSIYIEGKNVYKALGDFHVSLINLEQSIISKARNKEVEELEILIKAVDQKIRNVEQKYSHAKSRYYNAEDEIEASSYKRDMVYYGNQLSNYKSKRNKAMIRLNDRGGNYNPEIEELEQITPTGGISNMSNIPTTSTATEYSLKEGDKVNIGGKEYELYRIGIDDDGSVSLFYFGEDDYVYCMDSEGNLTNMNIHSYDMPDTNIENQTGLALVSAYATNNEHAAEIGLPSQENITQGEPLDYNAEVYVDYGEEMTQTSNVPTQTVSTEQLENSINNYTIKAGDVVNINGNNYVLYRIGTDDDGSVSVFYVGEDDYIYSMDPEGNFTKMNILRYDMADTNIENQTGLALTPMYTTSAEHATAAGLPLPENITTGTTEIIAPETTDVPVQQISQPSVDIYNSNIETTNYCQYNEYSIKEGDTVTIDGNNYVLLKIGIDDDGAAHTFYTGPNNNIYSMGPDGKMTDTNVATYSDPNMTINYIENDTGYSLFSSYETTNANAQQSGLPTQSSITPGAPLNYVPETYVDYGNPSTSDITYVTSTEELQQAVDNLAPVISVDATEIESNSGIFSNIRDIKANKGETSILFVLNAETGEYCNLDSNGGFTKGYGNYRPEDMLKFTIEK